MLIQTDKLKRKPRQIDIDESATDFIVLNDLIKQGSVSFNDRIHGTLTATWAGDVIEVAGRLTSSVTMSCSRCLAPVSCPLDTDVLLCYSGKSVDAPVADDVEIRSEEMGLIYFAGTEIDLRPDLEQEIVMALPQQLLCRETCKGLCPVCGINFNQDQCKCERPVLHAGLEALRNYKVEQ
ncbi:MAG: hypothetical protein GTO60_02855 [Gammaproteobacteria bacterium]|nr:hypothetical protein [Gammaproteobacteria bacterium]NIN62459.1 hypothetical protein [Gammaproteobacteria bacterium]NIT06288.1 hypothetical protein [Gammaproteobacteria bacterium]